MPIVSKTVLQVETLSFLSGEIISAQDQSTDESGIVRLMSGYGMAAFGYGATLAVGPPMSAIGPVPDVGRPVNLDDMTTKANQFLPPGYRRSRASAPACPHVSKPTYATAAADFTAP
jgi:hypothetical protein